jgi:quercetin dioxygenase-like cupin family protein
MLKEIPKGWGKEVIIVFTELYCAKYLCYDRAGNKSSMHFHKNKDETFYVEKGSFKITLMDTDNAREHSHVINQGETWRMKPFTLHQVEALEDGSVILEVSTYDCPEDNYRVRPGDSQR